MSIVRISEAAAARVSGEAMISSYLQIIEALIFNSIDSDASTISNFLPD